MQNNFIFADSLSDFNGALQKGEILDEAIVFIGDAHKIWTHGEFFDCSTFNPTDINNTLQEHQNSIRDIKLDKPDTKEIPAYVSVLPNDMDFVSNLHGIFIMDAAGNLHSIEFWKEDLGYTGIAIITDKVSLVVGNPIWVYGDLFKDDYVVEDPLYSTKEEALLDFDGYGNTQRIAPNSDNEYFSQCIQYSKGIKGAGEWYLPSIGELNEIYKYIQALQRAYKKINISTPLDLEIISSTIHNQDEPYWGIRSYHNRSELTPRITIESSRYYHNRHIIPVAKIEKPVPVLQRISNLESKSVNWSILGVPLITFTFEGVQYQAEEGMNFMQWCDSDYNTTKNTSSILMYNDSQNLFWQITSIVRRNTTVDKNTVIVNNGIYG